MLLAKVVGNLVSTKKNPDVLGKKLLFVQPLDAFLNPFGDEMLAVDGGIGAGIDDIVVVVTEGRGARTVAKAESPIAPIEFAIAGIVDSIQVGDKYTQIR